MKLAQLSAQALLDDFPEPSLIMTADGTLTYLNAACAALFGLEESAGGVGQSITAFLPESERRRLDPLAWMARWADEPQAPELAHVHLDCRRADGSEVPVRVRVGRLVSDGDAYYAVTLQDLSEQLERLRESRRAHRLAARVLAISADAIVTVDEELVIRYANPAAEGLFGYGAGQLTGLELDTLLPEASRARHAEHIRAFARESAPARLMGERAEVQGLTRSGELIPLEASITKVSLDAETMFSAHLRDLRPRRRQTAELDSVFDHALQAMALIAMDGSVLRLNRAARQLLPADVEAVGTAFAELPFWSEDPSATARTLKSALENAQRGETVRMHAAVTLPAGTRRELDFSLTPVADAGGTFALLAEARTLLAGEE